MIILSRWTKLFVKPGSVIKKVNKKGRLLAENGMRKRASSQSAIIKEIAVAKAREMVTDQIAEAHQELHPNLGQ